MTAKVRLGKEAGQGARYFLQRAFLRFCATSKPEDIFVKKSKVFFDILVDLFSCLGKRVWQAIGLDNFLYQNRFFNSEGQCYLKAPFTNRDTRGARAGRASIKAPFSQVSGHNSARNSWLTTKGNVQVQRLYDRAASLTPFVEYQV